MKYKTKFVAVLMVLAMVLASCGSKQASQASVGKLAEKETQAAEKEAEAEASESTADAQEAADAQAAEAAETKAEEAEGEDAGEGYIVSADGGFSTRFPAEYKAEWIHEQDMLGGIRIYTGDAGEVPFVSIIRETDYEDDADPDDPEGFLYDYVLEDAAFESGFFGFYPADCDDIEEYTFGGKTLPGMNVYLLDEDENLYYMLVLVMTEKDNQLGEEHFIRLAAIYQDGHEEDKEAVMEVLDTAVRELHLDHVYFDNSEVQPGNLLLDFCNDEGLRIWFERALTRLPDELTYTSDRWHTITDPDMIRAVLEALKTVKIGDVSDAHVGASGRQIFEFYYRAGGEGPDFRFFQDTFDWGEETYDVLDWGDLKDLDLLDAAEN